MNDAHVDAAMTRGGSAAVGRPGSRQSSGRRLLPPALLLFAATSACLESAPECAAPGTCGAARNVILFIGDGMGTGQIQAAGIYAFGAPGTLAFEELPFQSLMSTNAYNGGTTDSAAAATAMATGQKVRRRVVALELPGNGEPLETILESMHGMGREIGIVTTAYPTHATPASFFAHVEDRYMYDEIAAQLMQRALPSVLFGGAPHIDAEMASAAGYQVVTDRDGMFALEVEPSVRVSGQFGDGYMPYTLEGLGELPSLSQMTRVALEILEQDPDGFLLVVEGARIDHAGHAHDLENAVFETLAFNTAVEAALSWAAERDDTLMLVTADHETGGLIVTENNGPGVMPTVDWQANGHTPALIPVFGWGNGAAGVEEIRANTDVYGVMTRAAGID